VGDEFRTIVHPYSFRLSFFVDQVVEHPYNTVTGHLKINLDMQHFSIIIINNIKGSKASFVL
jgi:hypothetical protein